MLFMRGMLSIFFLWGRFRNVRIYIRFLMCEFYGWLCNVFYV